MTKPTTAKPIMARATAVWLIDNTTLTFKQIGTFVDLHELEINGIADGDVDSGVRGFDPVANNQLDAAEIKKGEADPNHVLELKFYAVTLGEKKRQGARYTPLSKRQDRPAAIYWLTKFHPELSDPQISKLIGTTKPTITSIRDRSHWNISSIQPVDPVALGLCKQMELDQAVQKAAAKQKTQDPLIGDEETRKLVSTEQSLQMSTEPRLPSSILGLEGFSLSEKTSAKEKAGEKNPVLTAESLFAKKDESSKGDT